MLQGIHFVFLHFCPNRLLFFRILCFNHIYRRPFFGLAVDHTVTYYQNSHFLTIYFHLFTNTKIKSLLNVEPFPFH